MTALGQTAHLIVSFRQNTDARDVEVITERLDTITLREWARIIAKRRWDSDAPTQ